MLFQNLNIENLSRKEREKLYKRTEILSAAVPLFAEKGYENTTIEDIAEKAEFGKGTIYNYFQGKEDIYIAILDEVFKGYLESLKQINEECDNFYDFIKKLTYTLFDFCVNNHHAFIVISRLRTNMTEQSSKINESMVDYQNGVNEIFNERIELAIKNEEIRKIDADSLVSLYRSMIFPYIYNQMFCTRVEKIDIESESELVISVLFNGIKK